MDRCRQLTHIRLLADDKTVQTTIDIEKFDTHTGLWQRLTSFVLDMRHVAQDPADKTSRPPPALR